MRSAPRRGAKQKLLYLDGATVTRLLDDIDVLGPIERALVAYSTGEALLPEEAYLGWETSQGDGARSICLPAGLPISGELVLGLKVINSSLGNTRNGMARAAGLGMLFDKETARVQTLMSVAGISATRTAAVSFVGVQALAARRESLCILGCGVLGQRHAELALTFGIEGLHLFDVDTQAAERLQAHLRGPGLERCRIVVESSAKAAVEASDVIITTTTSTAGYIPMSWLRPGAIVVHVSLDDVLPEVVAACEWRVVDSWRLVSADRRRLVGRMVGQDLVCGPDDQCRGRVQVNAELGEILAGRRPPRLTRDGNVLFNPFGMGVGDVALMEEVAREARTQQLGVPLAL